MIPILLNLRQLFAHGDRLAGFTGTIIDRCNLTVLLEPGQEDLPVFLAEHNVRVVASLPCYGFVAAISLIFGRNFFATNWKHTLLLSDEVRRM